MVSLACPFLRVASFLPFLAVISPDQVPHYCAATGAEFPDETFAVHVKFTKMVPFSIARGTGTLTSMETVQAGPHSQQSPSRLITIIIEVHLMCFHGRNGSR